ncbi:alcohol dehydrogenase [Rhizomicrobium sp. SCGC AG-212-E05]|nr:alcohol dehydrogenase [Rhizomicrobium sp. SCGC AG-212-E05]
MRRVVLAVAFATFSTAANGASVEAGRYQSVLGDCEGCHGKNLAGGIELMTPFGKLVAPNITPDKTTGIGNYTAEDFRRAMKEGIAPGGKRLYPAMPYPAYAKMSDAAMADLWAYFKTVKPVRHAVNVNQLRFPFNLRFTMRGWNMLFFRPALYAPDAGKSAAWNRGAYIATGPAHCGTCHTPKSVFGADKGVALSGAALQGWFAPDLTGDRNAGLGGWSAANVVEYLKTGRNAHSIASGPMAEVIEHSTNRMNDTDLRSLAVYLKTLPASAGNGGSATGAEALMKSGAGIYRMNCAACHSLDGRGDKILFPPLAGNALVRQTSAETLVRVVLAGTKAVATREAPTGPGMPSFAWKLNDAQVASLLTYIRNNWGNRAPAVSTDTVAKIRTSLRAASH